MALLPNTGAAWKRTFETEKTTNKIHEDGADAALNRQLKHAFIKLKQDPP